MSVHPSNHLLVYFVILCLSLSVLSIFLYPSFRFLCSHVSLIPSVCFFHFSLSSRLKCWHNISATCTMASRGHRNIERTFPGPRVCASACPSSSSSSSRSPPTVAQMRLRCTDSADFLSDGCKKKTQ